MYYKLATSFLIGLLTSISFAQNFAVIKDDDGFVNVRSEAKISNNITNKLVNGDLVFYFEDDAKDNWQYITYKINNEEAFGYVYKNRLAAVSNFLELPVFKEGKNDIIFKNKNLELQIKVKPFAKNNSKITYLKNTKIVDKINDKKVWGTDGYLPKNQYNYIKLITNTNVYNLPIQALFNLYEPNLKLTNVYLDIKTNSVFIEATNGDGAGGYTFIMVIQSEVYKERLVLHPF